MIYNVRISEELARTIEIEAEDEDEAYDKAYDMYRNCEVVLTSDDFIGEPDIQVGEYMSLEEALAILHDKGYSINFLDKEESEDYSGAKIMATPIFDCIIEHNLFNTVDELIDFAMKVRDRK